MQKRSVALCSFTVLTVVCLQLYFFSKQSFKTAPQLQHFDVYRPKTIIQAPESNERTAKSKGRSQAAFKELREFVQSRLRKLQNPRNCTTARKLLCKIQTYGCGFGCQLHYISTCLMLAAGTNRTLVLKHILTAHPSVTSINEAYLPLSETCSDWSEDEFNEVDHIQGDGVKETTGDKRVVKYYIYDLLFPFTLFAPNSYPLELKDKLEPISSEPQVWWVGQLMTYITRQQPNLTRQLDEIKESIGFLHPIIGVHVRRTDKFANEAEFRSLQDYMDHVARWFDNYENVTGADVTRRVFLATDDVGVHEEARKKYPTYTFLTMSNNTLMAQTNRQTNEGFWGIVQDLALLSECDYVVCTFTSNIGRLIHEMFLANWDLNGASAKSIDADWFFPGQIGIHEAVTDYEPRKPEELQLRVGDILKETRCQIVCRGRNTRTNETGVFHMESARMVPVAAPYAALQTSRPVAGK